VYRVLGASAARSRLESATRTGLTPLVGRVQEVALLRACWTRVTEGLGQVVLLGGEAGIGKSRLVQGLKAYVAREGHPWLECQGSPYYQHTALYPLTELLARRLLPEAPVAQQVQHLEAFVRQQGLTPEIIVPLLAPLLSLPLPATYAPVRVTPAQQRQHTLHALLDLLLRLAAAQPLLLVIEDLHWVDPTTLALLSLLVDQGPTTRMLVLCTYRPDFSPPWTGRAHCTQMTLPRLSRQQATAMTERVAHRKALPPEVREQIVAKTDGVPLFVEELTKMVLESGLLQERAEGYALTGPLPPLAIPATLHDSLMARLDRLATVKSLAQLGATLGHEFSYAVLHAVAPWEEGTVQQGLRQLVEAEFLYQCGVPPQATYTFKHALIQDVAYQSLLRRTRQQYHQRIAQVLEAQFPETAETQPELLAYHYTEAGLSRPAVGYWQRAGHQAHERSAHLEAVQHLTTGLALLGTLGETPARAQQELEVQLALGVALTATKGAAHMEVEQTYARARALCQQLGDSPHLFPTLLGLCRFYRSQGALRTSLALGAQLDRLAQRAADPTHRLEAHDALGTILFNLGDYTAAWTHVEQGLALADLTRQRAQALHQGEASGLRCLGVAAQVLWCLGYPAQAVQRSQEALALAQSLAHPYSLAAARHWAISLHYRRREVPAVQTQAEALLVLATAQGFPVWVGHGTCWRGWGLAIQGEGVGGRAQLHQGLAAVLATGQELFRSLHLLLLAETAEHAGQIEDGLCLLLEALTAFEATGQGDMLAEAYRLQGALRLQQAIPDVAQAEASFHLALDIARRQQAKSWELRAATSLARLWHQQGKRAAARALLAPVYGWFTEGFDTADLQDAKVLLEELGG
jgi:predicted ATPase